MLTVPQIEAFRKTNPQLYETRKRLAGASSGPKQGSGLDDQITDTTNFAGSPLHPHSLRTGSIRRNRAFCQHRILRRRTEAEITHQPECASRVMYHVAHARSACILS